MPANVRHAALFFSDAQGWTEADGVLAQALADHGILVAGVDWHHYAEQLAKPRDKCSYIAGEFEDFSHEMQKRFSPARHHLPVLIGEGASAPLVYAVAAQGSSGTFVGTLTIGFQPHWQPPLKLCQSYELRYSTDEHGAVTLKPSSQLSTPWIDLHASSAKTFSAADLQKFVTSVGTAKSVVVENRKWREPLIANVEQLALPDREQKILADELKDLPLEEVRATGTPTSQMAMFLTGDGGWAEIDKGVSTELSKRGIDVVALSSLQYFWKPRSPDETAKDVARVVRHYLKAWNKSEVLLVGYSFGADVAPFVVNRLPDELRTRIVSVNLLGLAELADFEVHVTTWLGVEHHGLQTKPEVERLDTRVLCVFGEGEKDSLCPSLTGPRVTRAKIGDGHHFGDQYKVLADRVIAVSQNR
ncbi:MAG TPA: AcvB/VirJ family lysyl-phosphatidylglycerol hydrolase, partial [Steroidobacteraceae bacterium]|nr:AcvB/VirJ family lysyl-phosphatidylglycerol hydrolase [Steroidobacteraceae bacterium]